MAIPLVLLQYKVELQLAGVWTDITPKVRFLSGISLKRGNTDWSPKLTTATANLTLDNRNNDLNPRNPLSPYYGKLVRNTPIRISDFLYPTVKGLWTGPILTGGASAPDSVGLSITGDLDIRAESPVYQTDYYWVTKSGSYALRSVGGFLQLQWVRTAVTQSRNSTLAIPAGHTAFRATLDVDNGAAGHTVTFYTAANWGDPWVQLGATVVTAGTTAIDDSSGSSFLGGTTADYGPLCVRQAEIRSGIAGSVVASPNPSAQADGTTAWADAQGNNWTVDSDSRIGSGVSWYAFFGEVYSFEPEWTQDWVGTTAKGDSWVDINPSGAIRRIVKNDRQPKSYYRSWWDTRVVSPVPKYFWPLEEGSDAGTGLPDIGQGGVYTIINPFAPTGTPVSVGWGQAAMNDWIPNGVAIGHQNELHFPCDMRGSVSSGALGWEISCLITLDSSDTINTGAIFCGTVNYLWVINTDQATDPANPQGIFWVYTVTDSYFNGVGSSVRLPPLKNCGPIWLVIRGVYSGGNTSVYFSWKQVSDSSNSVVATTASTRSTSAMEWPREIMVASANNDVLNPNAKAIVGLSALSVSEHFINGTANMSQSLIAAKGAPGEWTFDRYVRLCLEQGINATASGNGSVQLGRQYIQSFEDHLNEILASSLHGNIVESRSANELLLLGTGSYRGTFNYTDLVPGLRPAEDDQSTSNVVLYKGNHSNSMEFQKTTGPMSVAAIGAFKGELNGNNWTLAQGFALAGLMLNEGTWDGPRFPEITLSARATPALYNLMRTIDVGDFFGLQGLGPVGYYDLMIFKVLCIEEDLRPEDHIFKFTVKPGELEYRVWTVGTNRVDITDCTVAVGGSGATIDVNVPTAKWTAGFGSFDVMVAGERMTVSAVSTLTSTTQRLSVARAVNGVVKSTPVGAEVHIYPGFFIKAV
jgi:hypothetical protein